MSNQNQMSNHKYFSHKSEVHFLLKVNEPLNNFGNPMFRLKEKLLSVASSALNHPVHSCPISGNDHHKFSLWNKEVIVPVGEYAHENIFSEIVL